MRQQEPCERVSELVRCFQHIYQTRMQDMPMVNPALSVDVIGFRTWQQRCVGILITPWFMNLIVLFEQPTEKVSLPHADEKYHYQFPSGHYEFLVCHEESLGLYHSCSLFSPMFDFNSQELAQQTAQHILTLLWQAPEKQIKPKDNEKKTLSRRELLRGKFSAGSS
ncbi:[NiFe]-hydrogenase assembly chaperone HybE [Thioflexithrix psekupsensis]|uniref:Rubredoxin n=1 Tax=Thioflexithrix psekupsensis TaxID=1570016 RepID=A0A251X8R4_9GAMM|nr:[NiFe]-hydrogenase assembly chaperone HybE [Thioflexithrix psekupsensis]OUD13922.1 hypothetical protein TPSD3_06145 [Thioflexithrix psekupsensis]